jgi:serine/threonine protein kinase
VIIKTVFERGPKFARSSQALFNEAFVLGYLAGRGAPELKRASVSESERLPYLVRENVPGVSLDKALANLIASSVPPSISDVHFILIGVCEALVPIHGLGVIHGDIKPANIVCSWTQSKSSPIYRLDTSKPIRLIDFEGATLRNNPQSSSVLTARGTPYFMAPERYAASNISDSADVYSVSALASLLFTGRPERPGSQAGARIPGSELRSLIRRGLSIDYRARPATILEWIDAFESAYVILSQDQRQERVDWPRDSVGVERELAEESVTVNKGSRGAFQFLDVGARVDAATVELVLARNLSNYDATTQDLIQAVWLEGTSLKDAARDLSIPERSARERLEKVLDELDSAMRQSALESERERLQQLSESTIPTQV